MNDVETNMASDVEKGWVKWSVEGWYGTTDMQVFSLDLARLL